MATYIDERDAAIAAIQALIGPNGVGAITGQVHQDNEVNQTNDAYLNLVGYDNYGFVIVRTGINTANGAEDNTSVRNGINLTAAYANACTLTPGGSALGPNNRAAVLIPPGVYSFSASFLNLDTQYVDLIGLGTPEDIIITSTYNTPDGRGTITKTVNDVVIKNITIKNDAVYASGPTPADVPSGFAPQGSYSNEVIENVIFKSDATKNPFMRLDHNYTGTYRNCKGIGPNVGSPTWVMFAGANGTFENCTTTENGFGYFDGVVFAPPTTSGTFINCKAFAGFGYDTTAGALHSVTGTYTNCEVDFAGFGISVLSANATWTNCIAGKDVLVGAGGWIALNLAGEINGCYVGRSTGVLVDNSSANILNCTGGQGCFNINSNTGVIKNCVTVDPLGSGITSSFFVNGGAVIDCKAEAGSFAGLGTTFINCIGADSCFRGAGISNEVNGRYVNCIAGEGSFNGALINGSFEYCVAGDNSFGYSSSSVSPVTFSGAKFLYCKGGEFCFGVSALMDVDTEFHFCEGKDRCFGVNNGGAGQYIRSKFYNCTAGSLSFAVGVQGPRGTGPGDPVTAEFHNCTGGDNCFGVGGGIEMAGLCVNCTAGNWSFGSAQNNGSGRWVEASGRFHNCVGGDNCFGSSSGLYSGSIASGEFINCTGGQYCFGASQGTGERPSEASGVFKNCTGGNNCFGATSSTALGYAGAEASGQFYNCQSGTSSFGSNNGIGGVNICYASGYFVDCCGGSFSFAGHANAYKTGKFIRCVLQGDNATGFAANDEGPLVENGLMEDCTWVISGALEPALVVANLNDPIAPGDEAPKIYGGKYIAGAGATRSIISNATPPFSANPKASILQIRSNVVIDGSINNLAISGALDTEGNYTYSGL